MIVERDRPGLRRLGDPTPALGGYVRLRRARLARMDPARTQARLLAGLVQVASGTRFGQMHRFERIRAPKDFGQRVPLRDFEDFWREWWEADFPTLVNITWPGKIPLFAKSSGTTTGRSKYIPYTPRMRRAAVKGLADLLAFHLQHRPDSRVLGGAVLGLVGPTALQDVAGGVQAGAVSAITARAAPAVLRRRLLPPPELAEIVDWSDKIRRLAQLSLRADLRAVGGSPNWMLAFFREVARQAPGSTERLVDWFPNLELIVHGGIGFAPYRDRFARLLAGGRAETREVYSASEGFFACADRGDGDGLRLLLDAGVFYEFIPVEDIGRPAPRRDWIATARTGTDYALAVTTASGLWAYLLGDVVRLVSLDPPRILVRGRLSSGLSTVGEHLIEPEIVSGVTTACAAIGRSLTDFTVSVSPTEAGAPGRHVFWVECDALPDEAAMATFATALDQALMDQNEDYREIRHGDCGLAPPRIRFVPVGGFAMWLQARRAAGGQNKVARVVQDPRIRADLEDFMETLTGRETPT